MGHADAMRFAPVFQRSLLPDQSDLTFPTTPGTDDSHVCLVSPLLDTITSKNYAEVKEL
jgi:hypothetical protein